MVINVRLSRRGAIERIEHRLQRVDGTERLVGINRLDLAADRRDESERVGRTSDDQVHGAEPIARALEIQLRPRSVNLRAWGFIEPAMFHVPHYAHDLAPWLLVSSETDAVPED